MIPSPPLALTLGGTSFLCLTIALFALHHRSGRAYLWDWATGWLAAVVWLGAGLVADVQVTPRTSRIFLAVCVFVAVAAVMSQSMLQIQGMRRLTLHPRLGVRMRVWLGVAVLVYATLAALASALWEGTRGAFVATVALPHVVLGLAFLVSAWDLHKAGRRHGFGAWLLPIAFTGYGLHNLRVALTPARTLPVPHSLTMGFLGMFVAFAIVYGAVAWTLDEEAERLGEASARHELLEAQLLEAQKLEALGQLAAGVAHDFNNLLTVIGAHAELIELEPGHDQRTLESLREIRTARDRGSRLVTHLLIFARKQVLQPESLDPNEVVSGLQGLLRPLIGDNVVLDMPPSTTKARVEADRGHLEQLIVNLVVNARDAMPGGGRVVVEVGEHVSHRPTMQAGIEIPAGRWVVFRVTDTGAGMSEEVRTRAFEPFFTTKARGHGTGLGLATVYGIVEQSRGHIAIESEPGKGSTFTVFLPAVTEDAVTPRASIGV